MSWMCTTFYSYFWVPNCELTTKGLVSIPSHTLETVNETEVSPFYPFCPPPPTLHCRYSAPRCVCLFIVAWFGLFSCLFHLQVKSYGIFLPPLPSSLPYLSCLPGRVWGEPCAPSQDSVSLLRQGVEGDAAPVCEVQAPWLLYSSRMCVYIFLDS